jgi:crotonobetainyl-CoA:carnitine CoA-transferase CaiB-like acyl-CoA transferase
LLESLLDFQFELLTTYYTNRRQPERSIVNNGHPLLSAPYGIYQTADGYLALAMMDIHALAKAIECKELEKFSKDQAFSERDEIKTIIASQLLTMPTAHWLRLLQNSALWAMEVFDWEKMMSHDAYKCLQMEQRIKAGNNSFITTRCPIRINNQRLFSSKPAPQVGEHTEQIRAELIN